MFPPAHLISQDILELPPVNLEPRKLMVSRGAALPLHSSRQVLQTLAHGLYKGLEGRESTIQTAALKISLDRRVLHELSEACVEPAHQNNTRDKQTYMSPDRVDHNIAIGLKDSKINLIKTLENIGTSTCIHIIKF